MSEKILSMYRNSSVGDVAVAYLMYKIATPARYTVTLAGTNVAIRYLRKIGYMAQKQESESLRNLAKESRQNVRSGMKRRSDKIRSDLQTRITARKITLKARQDKFVTKRKQFVSNLRRGKK